MVATWIAVFLVFISILQVLQLSWVDSALLMPQQFIA